MTARKSDARADRPLRNPSRGRQPGPAERGPAKVEPDRPPPAVGAAALLQLNRLAGNAAVAAFVRAARPRSDPPSNSSPPSGDRPSTPTGAAPVLQRMELNDLDKERVALLGQAGRIIAEQRITAFTGNDALTWRHLTYFSVNSNVEEEARKDFLGRLYQALGDGEPLDRLQAWRETLDKQWGDEIRGRATAHLATGQAYQGQAPAQFAPRLGDLTRARANLGTGTSRQTEAKPAPGRSKPSPTFGDSVPRSGRHLPPPPVRAQGKEEVAPGPSPVSARPGQVVGPAQGTSPARRPVQAAPRGDWSHFPEEAQAELMKMWRAWQTGGYTAATLYEEFYKKSDAKADSDDKPTAGEYVADLDKQGLLGAVNKDFATNSGTLGYPMTLPATAGGMPGARIYLNPHLRHIADVYGFVKQQIHGAVPGVLSVKLADHVTAMAVRDVIVIYLAPGAGQDAARSEVVRRLEAYQTANKGYFIDEVPRLTEKLLPGVGFGAEPPIFGPIVTQYLATTPNVQGQPFGYSFSSYRCELVAQAIEDSGGDPKKFQARVADYFFQAGINLAQPARQGTPQPSSLRLLGMVTDKPPDQD